MTIMTIDLVMDRIKSATRYSPIAVFHSVGEGKLDALFASTVMTEIKIRKEGKFLVGVYHQYMDLRKIYKELKSAMEGLSSGHDLTFH